MIDSYKTPARELAPGMGQAVAERTILRKVERFGTELEFVEFELPRRDDISLDEQIALHAKNTDLIVSGYTIEEGDGLTIKGTMNVIGHVVKETWADVAFRVAQGSSLLQPITESIEGREGEALANLAREQVAEFNAMNHHLRQASTLMSGRHLQHGDETQPERNIEVFTNCLDGSTRILTMEYGPVEIKKIAGQVVTVIAGDGVPRSATINEHGIQELNEIVFRPVLGGGGKVRQTVKATGNHRWKLKNGEVTENLKVGDVLRPIFSDIGTDEKSVVHGLIFGDGSAHKLRHDHHRHVSQGRTYAAIRVCKQDAVQDEIHSILDDAGYKFSTPPHSKGDRIYYIGKEEHFKDLPYTNDPEYIAGFIYGWWLADGSKAINHAIEISTADESAANWVLDHAAYAGMSVTSHRILERKEGDGSFKNGKPLHCFRIRRDVEWKVDSIEPIGRAKVYCPEEPVTSTFVLANGLLTGNCSTSAMSFLSFYLLLNGSGVGRAYDDEMMLVDWNYLPLVIPVIDYSHKDVQSGEILATSSRDVAHFYKGKNIIEFEVADSREGWTKAFEKMEYLAFTKEHKNSVLIMDFSKVRERGAPIKGMQNRPASGPGPMMKAVENIAKLRGAGMAPWRSTMFADHFLAECVLVGGARRAARMATKYWKDETVLDFISVKQGGFLWSSNNSVTVDQEFWSYAKMDEYATGRVHDDEQRALIRHAQAVFEAVCSHSYHDGTGEPGFINVDKLTWSDKGIEALLDGEFAESEKLQLSIETLQLSRALARAFAASEAKTITNPCGEIVLGKLGGYCVIADVVPYYAQDDTDAEDAFRVSTRALIRTNLMDALYGKEVKRTNRIGVGMTGLHEYAWKRFGYGFRDIINEEKSIDFWLMLARFKRAVQDEAKTYSAKLGVSEPHTNTTMKPSGTCSKLFGLTEGAHLPSMREYMRWVQFRNDDPLIAQYEAMGYPVKRLITYSGTTVVGFPTSPEICTLGMGDKLVTAAEATPEEQYQYLRLLEKYWITGVEEDGVTPLEERGNQVSYTLKYAPGTVSYDEFKRTLLDGQSTIRCCSVMPQTDGSAYEYQPEEPCTKAHYEIVCEAIAVASNGTKMDEDVGMEHVACEGGACPISFNENT